MLLDTRRQELWDISRYSENLTDNFNTFPLCYTVISNRRRKRLVTYDKVLDGAATVRPPVQVKAQAAAVHCNNITV
jgi:hypothetical protein